ncbi:PKD domain-containing protein, partial [candidate division KSB1 bacterium]|nr:PKD domain-containing protein [candidate division KSB1 bacterium]
DLSTGVITSWHWDFGDSTTSTEPNPSHVYQTADTFTVSLTAVGPGGEDTKTRTNYIITSNPSEVDGNDDLIPERFELSQNFPNPFNASTTIDYAVPELSYVWLAVYNVRGVCVCELVNGLCDPGMHQIHFDASRLGSGLYFYRMESNSKEDYSVLIRKMILLK